VILKHIQRQTSAHAAPALGSGSGSLLSFAAASGFHRQKPRAPERARRAQPGRGAGSWRGELRRPRLSRWAHPAPRSRYRNTRCRGYC